MGEIQNGTLGYRVGRLEDEHEKLENEVDSGFAAVNKRIDRLIWALVMLSLSITGSTVVATITYFYSTRGG